MQGTGVFLCYKIIVTYFFHSTFYQDSYWQHVTFNITKQGNRNIIPASV